MCTGPRSRDTDVHGCKWTYEREHRRGCKGVRMSVNTGADVEGPMSVNIGADADERSHLYIAREISSFLVLASALSSEFPN